MWVYEIFYNGWRTYGLNPFNLYYSSLYFYIFYKVRQIWCHKGNNINNKTINNKTPIMFFLTCNLRFTQLVSLWPSAHSVTYYCCISQFDLDWNTTPITQSPVYQSNSMAKKKFIQITYVSCKFKWENITSELKG